MDQTIVSDVRAFLKKNFVAVLGTSYLNLPFASSIYYTIDDKLNFYFTTKTNTDKYLNLRTNRNVALVVSDRQKNVSVQVRGHATVLKDKRWRKRITEEIKAILHAQNEEWPIYKIKSLQSKNAPNDEIVYKVIPQHFVFTNLDDSSLPNSMSDEQHSIISLLNE